MLNGKRFTYIHILYQKNCAVNFVKMRTCFCHAGRHGIYAFGALPVVVVGYLTGVHAYQHSLL